MLVIYLSVGLSVCYEREREVSGSTGAIALAAYGYMYDDFVVLCVLALNAVISIHYASTGFLCLRLVRGTLHLDSWIGVPQD